MDQIVHLRREHYGMHMLAHIVDGAWTLVDDFNVVSNFRCESSKQGNFKDSYMVEFDNDQISLSLFDQKLSVHDPTESLKVIKQGNCIMYSFMKARYYMAFPLKRSSCL